MEGHGGRRARNGSDEQTVQPTKMGSRRAGIAGETAAVEDDRQAAWRGGGLGRRVLLAVALTHSQTVSGGKERLLRGHHGAFPFS